MSEEAKDIQVLPDKIPGLKKDDDESLCRFPGCNHAYMVLHDLVLTDEKDAVVQLPFCWYHYYIVIGGRFTARKVGDWKFEVQGPFEEVELIEQVMAARELVTKIKADAPKPGVVLTPGTIPVGKPSENA